MLVAMVVAVVVLVGAAFAFIAVGRVHRLRLRQLVIAGTVFFVTVLPFPMSIKFSGRSSTGEQFLSYQILRRLGLDRLSLPTLNTMTQAGGKLQDELVAERADRPGLQPGPADRIIPGAPRAAVTVEHRPCRCIFAQHGIMGV